MTGRDRLRQLVLELAVKRGHFTLASGRTSNWYLDCRQVTLHPEGAWLIAREILETIRVRDWKAEAIGGLTLGADPISGAVAAVSHEAGRPIPAFIVRKASKDHGLQKRIEGASVQGRSVIVVDDVVTTAGSTLEAIAAVQEAGGTIGGVLCVVDREEGGAEKLAAFPYEPLLRRRDLGIS